MSVTHRPKTYLPPAAKSGAARRVGQLLLALVLGWLLLQPATAAAQITDDSLSFDDNEVFVDDNPILDDTMALSQDSIAKDTVLKIVKEKTDLLDPLSLMNGGSVRRDPGFRPEEMMYPDMLHRLDGFAMTLGQWGMPYQRFRYGAEAANFDQGHFINPLTGAEDVYFLDTEHGMRYYDTHTPYLNAYYGQGKADAAQMRVDVAQNVHPLWNVAALYYRRQCKGVYTNLVTDQNTVGASTNFHTLNERYQAFGHYLIQQHDENVNGGVVVLMPDSILFDKGSQPVALVDARLRRLSRAVAFKHFYRFTKDTLAAKHTLSVYNGMVADYFLNQFTDDGLTDNVNGGLFPVYPTLGDSAFFYERMDYSRVKVNAGVTYRLNTPNWKARQRVEIAQEFIQYTKKFQFETPYNRSSVLWKGDLINDPNPRSLEAHWTYRQTLSNLFRPETYGELEVAYRFPKWQLDYTHKVPGPPLKLEDSTEIIKTHRPLALVLHTVSYGRNPSLQQAYGDGWPGNAFVGQPGLNNRRMRHLSIGIELHGKDHWTKSGPQVGNHIRVSLFSTQQTGMIYSNGFGFVQAGPKESVGYFGAEFKVRVHLRNWYLETETVAQGFGSNSQKMEDIFLKSQPKFYSKSSVFYENRNLKTVNLLRFGLDYYYFSTYDAPYFEPATQAFYAQGQLSSLFQFAYPRADLFLSAQVKKAFIYLKFINLLEGLPQAGYFTTMGYPMQVRQLQLGLNWTFLD